MAVSNEPEDNQFEFHAGSLGREAYLILRDMYSTDSLPGTESPSPVSIDRATRVSPRQGRVLNDLVRQSKSKNLLEVGLAYGFSTVWMMDAISGDPAARHTAIDPFQKSHWKGVGLSAVMRFGEQGKFRWINERSDYAIATLAKGRNEYDFIYIDGNHRFDDVIVDFYLADQVLRVGGYMVLDDMWMPSIVSAVNFVKVNRQYEVVPAAEPNLAVFRKVADDQREWRHFVPFKVQPGPRESGILRRALSILGLR